MYTTTKTDVGAHDTYEEQLSKLAGSLPGEGEEPKKEDDDDDDDDDDDYTPYTEPEIGDDPDTERVKIPIM